MKNKKRYQYLPVLGLLLAMVLWASSFAALKMAFPSFHPTAGLF
jgi:hypothetical protein